MASPNLSEIVTTTLRNRSKTLSDNMSNHNALLRRLRENGNQTSVTGRDIVRELEYADNGTVQFYSGYETLDVSPSDVLSAAVFDYKQLAGNVTISGLEQVKNSGTEALINLLEARINVLEKSLMNSLSTSLYSDGTGTSGKEVGGLQLLSLPMLEQEQLAGLTHQHLRSGKTHRLLQHQAPLVSLTCKQI
jgi:hypothetical protein